MPPWIERLWYGRSPFFALFLPLSLLFTGIVRLRRWWCRNYQAPSPYPAPLWVVGNLSVGGTGKTPVVLALIELAREQGLKVAVVSRGYGGQAESYPVSVEDQPHAKVVGDEPLLIWQRTAVPVVVAPERHVAVKLALERYQPDWILSDDGLQHYALHRDRELLVVDSQRGFGNGWCLPAGPLREPLGRIKTVDWVVGNGGKIEESPYAFTLAPGDIVSLNGEERLPPSEWTGLVHAVAGIGNPARFFQTLDELGLRHESHPFPDHHDFSHKDFSGLQDRPVLMTEKDAVKCRHLGLTNAWYLEVNAELDPLLEADMISAIKGWRT